MEVPGKSMRVVKKSMDFRIMFFQNHGEKNLKDLAKGMLYILNIFILKY